MSRVAGPGVYFRGGFLLIAVALVAVVSTFAFVSPWPQDPAYHLFADQRSGWGVRNAQNVLSNAGFLLVGAWGIAFVGLGAVNPRHRPPYLVFFLGVFLTALGSAWYHLQPGNATLVWDRLPMTVLFAGLFCAMVSEIVDPRYARMLLLPALAVGVASVVWWAWTESHGRGDLRLYGLVQFLPAVLVVLMAVVYSGAREIRRYIFGMILLLVMAKLAEHFDARVYELTGGVVGGHALKHLFAALAAACPLLFLYGRRAAEKSTQEGEGGGA